jgi:hypothetical protein
MGCGCGKTVQHVNAADMPDASGAVIAAARAGGAWRLTTSGGTNYDFPSLALARDAQRIYGGRVDQLRIA